MKDVYRSITDRIVRALETGVRSWHQPWNNEHMAGRVALPLRHNGVAYRGVNVLALWDAGDGERLHLARPDDL
jgi:antirestriction protein ArdC